MDYEKLHKDTIAKLQEMVNSDKITVEIAHGICADFIPDSEDERMVKFIKNQLFNIKKTITDNYKLDTELTKAIDWLEKKDEKQTKGNERDFSNSAWSEEDEDNMTNIEDRLSDYLDYIREDTSLTKHQKNSMKEEVIGYVNWLKSLRPQSAWKPSGEQMHYLSWIANVFLGDSLVEQEVSKHLNELLEDLKKLRSE